MIIKTCMFDGLEEEQDYKMSISTELDGKTIKQVVMTDIVSREGGEWREKGQEQDDRYRD